MRRTDGGPHARPESKVRREAVEAGYRSDFERRVGAHLTALGVPFEHEAVRLTYAVEHTYTPDFRLRTRSGRTLFIEVKGYMTSEERSKMLLVWNQNPLADIRFVFQRAGNPIRKGSKTTYAKWAEKAGFKWAEGAVPQEWLDE